MATGLLIDRIGAAASGGACGFQCTTASRRAGGGLASFLTPASGQQTLSSRSTSWQLQFPQQAAIHWRCSPHGEVPAAADAATAACSLQRRQERPALFCTSLYTYSSNKAAQAWGGGLGTLDGPRSTPPSSFSVHGPPAAPPFRPCPLPALARSGGAGRIMPGPPCSQ